MRPRPLAKYGLELAWPRAHDGTVQAHRGRQFMQQAGFFGIRKLIFTYQNPTPGVKANPRDIPRSGQAPHSGGTPTGPLSA